MTVDIESTGPYVNGYVVNFPDGTQTLERPLDPTLYYNTSAGGSYYVTREDDELDALAHRFYGDFKYWHIIVSANLDIISEHIFHLPAGLNLYIPSLAQFQN